MLEEPQGGTTRVFVSEHSHPGIHFRFEVQSTGEAPAFIPDEALMRVLCHLIIERLPIEAMPEVWENVRETWEWHSRPRLAAARPHQIVGLGVPVGAQIDAPPITIEEE